MGSFEEAPRRAGREQLKANNLWTTDPSQPPMITPDRRIAYTINATLQEETEIGWPNLFRGFLSDTWGFARFTISSIPTSLQSYSLAFSRNTIPALPNNSIAVWNGRNTVLHEAIIETEAIANAGTNAEIRILYQVKVRIVRSMRPMMGFLAISSASNFRSASDRV